MPTPNKPVLHCVVGDGSQQPKAVGFALAGKTTELSTDNIIIASYFSAMNSVSDSNFVHLVVNESGALLQPCSFITRPNLRSGWVRVCRDDSIFWPLVSRCKCYDWNILAYFGLPHWCVIVILYVGDNSPLILPLKQRPLSCVFAGTEFDSCQTGPIANGFLRLYQFGDELRHSRICPGRSYDYELKVVL